MEAGAVVLMVVFVSVLLSAGVGLTIVVFVSDLVAGAGGVTTVVLCSAGGAAGAVVSVFCSHAVKSATLARIQIYFFIIELVGHTVDATLNRINPRFCACPERISRESPRRAAFS